MMSKITPHLSSYYDNNERGSYYFAEFIFPDFSR